MKINTEAIRRQGLITAAINVIGRTGSLDVSVREIAREAGISPALAFYYFGDKDKIISETMRFLLRELMAGFCSRLRGKTLPQERLEAIVEASFSTSQFKRRTITVWLIFYAHAYSSKGAARLFDIYTRRLNSNLLHAYRDALLDIQQAREAAGMTGAMIDGLFIRHALRKGGANRREAIELCKAQISTCLLQKKGTNITNS